MSLSAPFASRVSTMNAGQGAGAPPPAGNSRVVTSLLTGAARGVYGLVRARSAPSLARVAASSARLASLHTPRPVFLVQAKSLFSPASQPRLSAEDSPADGRAGGSAQHASPSAALSPFIPPAAPEPAAQAQVRYSVSFLRASALSTLHRTQDAAPPPGPPHPWATTLNPVAPAPVVFVSPPPPFGRREQHQQQPVAPSTAFLSPLPPPQQPRGTPEASHLSHGQDGPDSSNADDIFGPLKAVLSHAKKRPAVDELLASYTPLGAMSTALATPSSGGGGATAKRQRVEGYGSGYGGGAAWHTEAATPGGSHMQQQQQHQYSGGMGWQGGMAPGGELRSTPFRSPQPVQPAYGMYAQRGTGLPTPNGTHRQMQAPGALLPMTPTFQQFMQPPPPQQTTYGALASSAAAPQPAVTQTARRIADTLQGLLGPQGGSLGQHGLADVAGPSALSRPSLMAPPPAPPFESLMTGVPPPPATSSQQQQGGAAVFDVPLGLAPSTAAAPPPPPAAAVSSGPAAGWDPEFMKRNLAHQVKAAEAAAQEASGQRITVTPKPAAPAPPAPAAPSPAAAAPAPAASGGWDAAFLAKAAADAKKAAEAAELEAKGVHITVDKKPAAAPPKPAPAPAFQPPAAGAIVHGGGFRFGPSTVTPPAPPVAAPVAQPPAPAPAPPAADGGDNGGKDWGIDQLRGLYAFTHDSAASFVLPPPVPGAAHTFRKAGKSTARCGVPMQRLYTFTIQSD